MIRISFKIYLILACWLYSLKSRVTAVSLKQVFFFFFFDFLILYNLKPLRLQIINERFLGWYINVIHCTSTVKRITIEPNWLYFINRGI